MTPFCIRHEFQTDPPAYWDVFFDKDYMRALYERIDVKEWRILDWKETETTIYRDIKVLPKRDIPGFVKKLLGGGDLGYTEASTYYKGKNYLDVTVKPTLLSSKMDMPGRYKVEALGPGRIARTYEGTMAVSLPLIGTKLEGFIISDMAKTYEAVAEFTAAWLKKRG